MTPDASLSVTPSRCALSATGPSITRDALTEQLAAELQKLEPLCLPPPKMKQSSLLHFRCEEFAEVNETWKKGGLEAVLERWGQERIFSQEAPDSRAHTLPSPSPDKRFPLILTIYEFVPDPRPSLTQINYYRSRNFEVPKPFQHEIHETLKNSGILERFLPDKDSVTQTQLSKASIEEIHCSCHWYGLENLYGDGTTLQITLTLVASEGQREQARLNLNKRGLMTRSLWVEELIETGYEGHAHLSQLLLPGELRAVLPLVAKLQSDLPPSPPGFMRGAWLANSFLPAD